MDGILNIHKPSGPSSFATVARVRQLVKEPKAGHGGTLDPLASGVLPVFLGQATRLAEYLMEYPKTYRAEIELGISTASYDREGAITSRRNPSAVTRDTVEAALAQFRGEIMQTPPVYSALKQHGQPLYKLAREGQDVEVESRQTSVYRLEIVSFEPPKITLEVECSKGTYIRSLAHDLGEALGCGAHLSGLIRTAYGPFDIKNTVTLEHLEAAVKNGSWRSLVQPMDAVLSLWQRIDLSDEQVKTVRYGVGLSLDARPEVSRLRSYDKAGVFTALLQFDVESRLWRPQKVFNQAAACLKSAPTLDNEAANGYIS